MATRVKTRDFTMEFFFLSKVRTLCSSHRVYKPETGVVARVFIFRAGISQSHNEINAC